MNALDLLFLLSGATLLLALLFGRYRWAAPLLLLGYAAQFIALLQTNALFGEPISLSWSLVVLDQPMHWRYDALSWFFALITLGAGFLSALYGSGVWMRDYEQVGHSPGALHTALAANVFAMVLLVGAEDFLSLFLGWELVSWATFFLMALRGGIAARAALRYLSYAFSGGMAILGAMALLYAQAGSLEFQPIRESLPQMSDGQLWVLLTLLGSGFGIKMGLLPFHLWQAPAYAETPGPGSAFFSAVSARMGLYAILVFFVGMVGFARLVQMEIPYTFLNSRDLLAWIAVLTILFPTYTALQQQDARYLLAWHGIGQGGYMVLGVLVGTANGSAGGLLHIFNHAITQVALLMAVFAVLYRTGTTDLNKLGGLVARMPLTFLTLLFGIISLAGLPPMAGFVSKLLVYRALLFEGMPLLFVGAIIGTLGTILSVYKLIHNIFLGQLRLEHESVQEAPLSMLIPMLSLSLLIFLSGYFPGPALSWVAAIQAQLGLPVVNYHLGGVYDAQGGFDMIWIVSVLLAGFGIGALVFFGLGGPSKRVHQLDNYAGGHFLYAENRYQYSDHFYAGLMHLIGPWYRGSFQWLERALGSTVDFLAHFTSGFYGIAQPLLWLLVAVLGIAAWAF